ncbi:response regulator transcription factor [Planosporangium flavigriseum]|uniref:DNA-binding response regulator n=1 Tax=Planosporangium flavigriseum TaxID=373681 RepID=A0A8J3PLR8_9ACTN|nr:response regulator transcription factor [Planosporangium flavigriseum]NJC63001.1 response regulator transcription factor [Planosporangium flavigriseum]GIG73128.1 DNA-binding response regulator [Planosporangium flavigriseum]
MSTPALRVLVVDDHPVVLDGVALALQRTMFVTVAGYARSASEAIEAARQSHPDVVLLDLRLPDMLAPETIRALLAQDPTIKIIIFTAYPDHAALDAALAAGAHGAVVKDIEQADLVDAIRRVAAGERVVYANTGHDGGDILHRKLREHGLTRREYEILRHVAMGQTNPEIATALGLTRNTVKTYLQRTMQKLGAHNRVEALARANQLGIL